MSLRLIVRLEAESDINETAFWYDKQRAGLGLKFLDEAHAAIDRVLVNPAAYRLMRRKPEVRRILLQRFPYRLFYILRPDAVVVFAVLHAKGRDRIWTERL